MAQESCDLNKDEAEILKPSSSTAPSPPSPTTTSPPPQPTATQTPEPQPPQSPPQPPPAQFSSRSCEVLLVEPSKKRKRADADADAVAGAEAVVAMSMAAEPLSPVLFVNRCNVCRKRVGLTGFRCRCEKLFCPRHRHSETHNCSFDYKTAGREEIARANPLIRAAKIMSCKNYMEDKILEMLQVNHAVIPRLIYKHDHCQLVKSFPIQPSSW